MRILIISPSLPYPATDGGSLRVLNLLKELARTAEVDLVGIDYGETTREHLDVLRQYCREVQLAAWSKPNRVMQVGSVVARFLRGEPFYAKYVDSPDLARKVYEMSRDGRYDIVAIEHSHSAIYHAHLHPQHGARTVLSMHNVTTRQYERLYDVERNPLSKLKLLLTLLPMRTWETRMAARFDKVVAVSEAERDLLLQERPDLDVAVAPNGVDVREKQPRPRENRTKTMLMVGTLGYPPNTDAALYFCEAILPLIREKIPDCRLAIVGKAPTPNILALQQTPGITVHADVPDVAPYFETSMLTVVPLRSGGGTRLKILESMAYGTPVVTTTIGCEGLEVNHGREALIADLPTAFADAVVTLMEDPQEWEKLSVAGRALVERRYDWRAIASDLERVYKQMAANPPPEVPL